MRGPNPPSATQTPHPAGRFAAATSIQRGVALKEMIGPLLVGLIAESVAAVEPRFDGAAFRRKAGRGLESMELLARSQHVAAALDAGLVAAVGADVEGALAVVVRSLGPPLTATAGNGLAPFFYFPHSHYLAAVGGRCEARQVAAVMAANRELTRRFTAEFSLRPVLVRFPEASLKVLRTWAADPDPHVRRAVSEATRPRLPWAMRLPHFQKDPALCLPLLELLKDDPDLYVRRSVANHLGDIAKDHPGVVFDLCRRWVKETRALDGARAEARKWLIRHAVRHPAKKEAPEAVALRKLAAARRRKAS